MYGQPRLPFKKVATYVQNQPQRPNQRRFQPQQEEVFQQYQQQVERQNDFGYLQNSYPTASSQEHHQSYYTASSTTPQQQTQSQQQNYYTTSTPHQQQNYYTTPTTQQQQNFYTSPITQEQQNYYTTPTTQQQQGYYTTPTTSQQRAQNEQVETLPTVVQQQPDLLLGTQDPQDLLSLITDPNLYLEGDMNDLEATLIDAATSAGGVKQMSPPIAVKKPRVPPTTPVRQSPSQGKRVSNDGRRYVTEEEEVNCSDSEATAAEEVHSPVPPRKQASVSNGKNKKRKRSKSASSDSSTGSDSTTFSRTSRASSHHSRATDRSSHKSYRSKKRYEERPAKKDRRESHKSRPHHPSSAQRPGSSKMPQPAPQSDAIMPPPPPSDEYNNLLYNRIMAEKVFTKDKDIETCSRTTAGSTASKKPKSSPVSGASKTQYTIVTPQDLLKRLKKNVPVDSEVTRHTVEQIIANCTVGGRIKRNTVNSLYEYVEHITVEPASQHVDCDDKINTSGYLRGAHTTGFGYSREDIEKGIAVDSSRLSTALGLQHNNDPKSLDMIFRKAMKEMSMRMNDHDITEPMSVENAILISGRSTELGVLSFIRSYYLAECNEDIFKYFTSCLQRKDSTIARYVKDSVCEDYVRALFDRYNLRSDNFNAVLEEPLTPKNMRVWTDRTVQSETNIMIMNRLVSVYDEVVGQRKTFTVEQKRNRLFKRHFLEEYSKRMKAFIDRHDNFLAELLKASEMMAWLCFGVTVNKSPHGTLIMGRSYANLKGETDFEKTDPSVCWNYPLASTYRKGPVVTTSEAFVLDSFWDLLEKEDQTDEHRSSSSSTLPSGVQDQTDE